MAQLLRGEGRETVDEQRFRAELKAMKPRLRIAMLSNALKDKRDASTPEASALFRDLKKRGWKFVGPTTMYAFMQAMGLVNDHQHDCFARREVDALRKLLAKP